MTVSSLQRRYLAPRTLNRRADETRLYTQDKDLHKSYSITFDDFDKPHADL